MPTITLPDGSQRQFDKPVTGAEVAAAIGPGLAKAALAVKLDGEVKDLADPITTDAKLEIVTKTHKDALELLRHDAAHVLAEAVQELFPGTQITFGPATESGFYYDFHRAEHFTLDDFAKIEQRMKEIVDRDEPITREVWARDQAVAYFKQHGETLQGRVGRLHPQGRGDLDLQAGQVAGHVHRPASALDGQARQGLQADEAQRRLLARRCQQPAAPAHLRHGVRGREAAEGPSPPARGGGEARPPAPGPRDEPLPPAGRGGRHGVLAPEGLDALSHAGEFHPRAARRGRLSRRSRRRSWSTASCGKPPAIGRSSARTCISPRTRTASSISPATRTSASSR